MSNLLQQGDLSQSWKEYAVTACIPHLETPDLLATSVRLWQLQASRPFILVIDTGSSSNEAIDCLCALESQSGVEVARLGITSALEHLSDRVAIAMNFAFSRCPTNFLLATHVDVFPKHRRLIDKLAALCGASAPVVGWEMSRRGLGADGIKHGQFSGIPLQSVNR